MNVTWSDGTTLTIAADVCLGLAAVAMVAIFAVCVGWLAWVQQRSGNNA